MSPKQGGKTTYMELLLFVSWAWWGLGFVRFNNRVEFFSDLNAFDDALDRQMREAIHDVMKASVFR